MKNASTDIYNTNDFYTASLLRSLGFEVLRIDFYTSKVATFVFSDPESNASEVIHRYWNRKIQIDARTLIDAINEMKTRLYAKQ